MEVGQDIAVPVSFPVRVGGRQAEEGLAAVGFRSPQKEVQLAAGAADLPEACALGGYLAEDVDGEAFVDGNHIVDATDNRRVVDKLQRAESKPRILVQPVIELPGAEGKACHTLSGQHLLVPVGELPCLVQGDIGIGAELGVHPQIL